MLLLGILFIAIILIPALWPESVLGRMLIIADNLLVTVMVGGLAYIIILLIFGWV